MRQLEARARRSTDIPMDVFRTVLAADGSPTRPLAELATAMAGDEDEDGYDTRQLEPARNRTVDVPMRTRPTDRFPHAQPQPQPQQQQRQGTRAHHPAPPVLSTVLEFSDSDGGNDEPAGAKATAATATVASSSIQALANTTSRTEAANEAVRGEGLGTGSGGLSRLSLPRSVGVAHTAGSSVGKSVFDGAAAAVATTTADCGEEHTILASRCALQTNAKTITALRNKHGVTIRCVDSKYAHFILSCRLAVDVLSQQAVAEKSTKDRVLNLSSEYNRPYECPPFCLISIIVTCTIALFLFCYWQDVNINNSVLYNAIVDMLPLCLSLCLGCPHD